MIKKKNFLKRGPTKKKTSEKKKEGWRGKQKIMVDVNVVTKFPPKKCPYAYVTRKEEKRKGKGGVCVSAPTRRST